MLLLRQIQLLLLPLRGCAGELGCWGSRRKGFGPPDSGSKRYGSYFYRALPPPSGGMQNSSLPKPPPAPSDLQVARSFGFPTPSYAPWATGPFAQQRPAFGTVSLTT
ncbi:unnamed protein product [Pleuronectes platessa]|uniref:Secreted protein n=1 Tax=Pleuronectes platessa TaxID=8262 RepID=A0A9N7Y1U4_PLEPL|nr:unnamed protein product [Pleuronectes platessa]